MRLWPARARGIPAPLSVDAHLDRDKQIAEGYLVARSALRLSVKNGIILTTIRDQVAWDEPDAARMARGAIDTLVIELSATADRLSDDSLRAAPDARASRSARSRADRARIARQRAEAERLTARSRTMRGVAELLQLARDDAEDVRDLVLRARDDALGELLQARLIPRAVPVTQTEDEQRAAIDGVKADLEDLMRSVELARVDW